MSLSNKEDYLQRELLQLNLNLDSIIEHPNWINIQSSHLCKGVFVLLHYDVVRSVFGKVLDIATVEQTIILCVQECYGHIFHDHYNAYEIKATGTVVAVNLRVLTDHRPLRARATFISTDKSSYYNSAIFVLNAQAKEAAITCQ